MSLRHALELASQRHGVLTLRRARAHGLDSRQLRRWAEQGVLIPVTVGVFRVAGAPRTYEQDVAMAIAAARGQAWASGACAARLLGRGRPWFDHAPVEIVVPVGTSAERAKTFGIVRQTRNLDPIDTALHLALPITSPLRTVVDCIGRVPHDAFRALVDDVLYRAGPRPTFALMAAYDRTSRARGKAWLDDAIAPWLLDGPPAESPKEISIVRVLVNAGLPMPERQVEIRDPITNRVIARADHAYRAERVAIEYLGGDAHGVRQANGDRLRDEDLCALDWVAAYARAKHLVPPGCDEYTDHVRDLLTRRGRQGRQGRQGRRAP
jgi:hypothetical protein